MISLISIIKVFLDILSVICIIFGVHSIIDVLKNGIEYFHIIGTILIDLFMICCGILLLLINFGVVTLFS